MLFAYRQMVGLGLQVVNAGGDGTGGAFADDSESV
jgi:hypothetical protein